MEVEHLLLLRQRVVLDDYPSLNVLMPLQFEHAPDMTGVCAAASSTKKRHKCIPVGWSAARNRVCASAWNDLVVRGEIPATAAHELCFFEQLSTRMLYDRGYMQCTQKFDTYLRFR